MREIERLINMLKENNIPFEEEKYRDGHGFVQHVVDFPSRENCQIEAHTRYFPDRPYSAGAPTIGVWTLGTENYCSLLTAETAFEYFKTAGLNAHKYTIHVSRRFTKNFEVVAHTKEEATAIVDALMEGFDTCGMNEEGWTFANENKDILEVK